MGMLDKGRGRQGDKAVPLPFFLSPCLLVWENGVPTTTFDPDTLARLAEAGLDPERLPGHVAVIMDGNGRWAKQRDLPRVQGHVKGVASVRSTVEECCRLGVRQLTLYCLSSENWKRPQAELDFLMALLEQYLIEERAEILSQNIRF